MDRVIARDYMRSPVTGQAFCRTGKPTKKGEPKFAFFASGPTRLE
jgi:hypothetical protein